MKIEILRELRGYQVRVCDDQTCCALMCDDEHKMLEYIKTKLSESFGIKFRTHGEERFVDSERIHNMIKKIDEVKNESDNNNQQ